MENNWFECKVKYIKVDNDGKNKKVTEPYLVDAVSFTEAEARMIEEGEKFISGDFVVWGISRSNIGDIFPSEDGDQWFKAKTSYIGVDENSGNEKKTNVFMLVEANNVKDAYERIAENLKGMVVPFKTPSVSESPIMDVFPFFNKDSRKTKIVSTLKTIVEAEVVIHPDYDPEFEYSAGDIALVNGEEVVIIENAVNAKFRKRNTN